jgi:signal peptidase I|tara:strand:+ start:1812 stop:2804 length:993 start_codon:yes stop_codon:yes gene_type:complete
MQRPGARFAAVQDDGTTASGGDDWADQILERARARSSGASVPEPSPEPEKAASDDGPDLPDELPPLPDGPVGSHRRPTLATVENPTPDEVDDRGDEFVPFADAYEQAGPSVAPAPFGDDPQLPPHLTIEAPPVAEIDLGIPGTAAGTARSVLEWVGVVLGALIVALLVKHFLFAAYYIPSPSMEPTLTDGDRIVVNKLSYRLHEVNRGDVVVFRRAMPQPDGINELIKRVIALPGETVEVVDGRVYVDGGLLLEPYLTARDSTGGFALPPGCIGPPDSINRCTVPDDHVFVMGDNRRNSKDSRVFGPVAESGIVGRAFLRVWPLGDLGRL